MANTYPGVYVFETPSTVHTIMAVPTAVAAFVGRARRGPVNTPVRIGSFGDFERAFGPLWTQSELGYAVSQYFLNGGADAYVVRAVDGALAASFALNPPSITVPQTMGPGIVFQAQSPGSWFADVKIGVDLNTRKVGGVTLPDEFNVQVQLTEIDPVTLTGKVTTETFRNVSYDNTSSQYVQTVINADSNLVRIGTAVTAGAPVANTYSYTGPTISDGTLLAPGDLVPSVPASRQGVYALDGAEIFTILYLPPYSPSEAASPDLPLSALQISSVNSYAALNYSIVLWDPPSATTPGTFGTWVTNIGAGSLDTYRASNSVMYYPWLDVGDVLAGNRPRKFGPSASVAGVMARIDGVRGVWKAPAGEEARVLGVNALEHVMSNIEDGGINPLGVNAIRQFPIIGTVVWGARTLDGADIQASQWKYVPIRRLAYNIEESLFRGTRWAVFEPNDEPLWAALRLNIGTFMRDLFRAGAFQGATPKDAYFVKCDGDTTTQSDRDRGIVNILVGFAPLKPAEFVVIRISQITAGAAA